MPQSDYWPFKTNKCNNTTDEKDFSGGPSVLQKQVGDMEGEVKEIQMELAAIKKERLILLNQKQGVPQVNSVEVVKDSLLDNDTLTSKLREDDLDYSKTPQISKLREDLIRAKNAAEEERFQREKYEGKLRDLELKLNSICSAGAMEIKESRKTSNEEVTLLKMQIRDMKEEVEEMKITVSEKNERLQEYRQKYLQAQQQVEEFRRQIDVIDFDNKQVSDQIQIEIQKMKMQFQEKLQELSPLPDLLKGAQIQLHEAKQLQKLAEDSSEQLSNELHRVKEKLVIAVNNLNQEKGERMKHVEENKCMRIEIDEKQKEIDDHTRNISEYKCALLRLEEKLSQQDSLYKEKSTECNHFQKELEELRSVSTRTLSRTKERSDSMRRYMQTQISELERQLIQSRAQCRACQKERDDVRQRMQIQINNLQENFELVEIRLRAIQNQVTTLKSSYSIILSDEDDNNEDKIVTI